MTSERISIDPFGTEAAMSMRRLRLQRGWTAQTLAEHCAAAGAAQEPPIPSTLTRARISKLESLPTTGLRLTEAYLIADVFDIEVGELVSGFNSAPAPLEQRVTDLETGMRQVIETLGNAGIVLEQAE